MSASKDSLGQQYNSPNQVLLIFNQYTVAGVSLAVSHVCGEVLP